MITGSLNAGRRGTELDRLAGGETVDVLVIGGGVTGTGVALDAVSRGLSVALIEAHDLAFGTSRWSSKLAHGGLRYLAKGDVALAHESAVERGILMTTTAPHLTRSVPQLFPLYPSTSRMMQRLVSAGLHAGDALRRSARTPASVLPRPRTIPAAEALALAPGLKRTGLRGALLSFDGALTDDARLVVALARTAASFGAKILTRVTVLEARGDGARVRDELTGSAFDIDARQVINATGVWAGSLAPSVRLRPSRGSHLVLPRGAAELGETSVLVPIPGESNRFVFLIPQPDGRIYLGLTDEPADPEIPDIPTVPESDVDFLLSVAGTAFTSGLSKKDVIGSFAGLRPLIDKPESGRSADLSRKHTVRTDDNGLITVVGGKLTTYRKMAADAVLAAIGRAGLPARPSRTKHLPLVGAAHRDRLAMVDAPTRLIAKYGTEAPTVAAIALLDPDLGKPLFEGTDITAAEVVWAVRHEGALDADDVLHRRTRLGLVPAEGDRARPAVEDLVTRALTAVS